jgi:hypothetical protein
MKSTGYIVNGVYMKKSVDPAAAIETDSITYKSSNQDRQREEHRRDLIQPYKDGRPNEEFIMQYPEEAKNYGFIKE